MNDLRFDIQIATADRLLVDVCDFRISPNRITFLFGESGIGKSLIARAMYGLLDQEEFRVKINGESYERYLERPETKAIKETSFYVFQEPSSHLNPLMPLAVQLKEGDLSKAPEDSHVIEEMWEGATKKEIDDLLEVYPKPYRPSGGEKQRMFLVMALKKIDLLLERGRDTQRCLFVFDEPTGSLDNHFRNVFLSLLFKRFQRSPFTTLLITHDYSMVSEVARSHSNIADQVAFRELVLDRGHLLLKDFKPETYLGWLNQQRPAVASTSSRPEGKPLLRVESGAEVFGQRLGISKDQEGKRISPLEIVPGSMVYLKAPSGTGKTTLVKMMIGLIRGNKLRLTINGMTLSEKTPRSVWQKKIWGKKMTMVFQHADEALNPRSTVAETFFGLPSTRQITREEIRKTLSELYDFEITDEFMDKEVSTLSGGQKQRLNLLRSMFLNTDILILDEPLNGLDFESVTKVLTMIERKQRAGKGILLISHNEEIFDAFIPKEHIYYLDSKPANA